MGRQAKMKVEVATIDSFQGRESAVVVVSTVRASNRLGYSDDPRRLNVLLTRAKIGLVVVGHRQTLETSSLWQRWLEQATNLSLADVEKISSKDPLKRTSGGGPSGNPPRGPPGGPSGGPSKGSSKKAIKR